MLTVKSLHHCDETRKLNVCAYARISRDKSELESSLDEQIEFYTGTIFSNNRWNFAGIYADDGISGTSVKGRAQFSTMVEKAMAGDIDIILVKSISRFARNVIDLLTTIRDLRNKGVEVLFEREGISSLDVKCDTYLTMYSKFAEEEVISMSKNVEWRNQKNFRDGNYRINASQIFGFKFDQGKKPVIDEDKAVWVREIFKQYAEGKCPAEICDFLEENKVRTVTGSAKWGSGVIRHMLRNEKYVGDAVMQKYYVESPLTHRCLTNRGQKDKYVVRDGHEGIVDRETWDKVQKRLDENAVKFKVVYRDIANLVTPYTAFGYCPYCHSNYIIKRNRKEKMLYCNSNASRRICQKSESVFMKDLDLIIPMQVKILKANEPAFREALSRAFAENQANAQREKIDALEAELEALRGKSAKLIRYKDPTIQELKDEIKAKIKEKSKEKIVLENEILTRSNPEARIKSIISELRCFPAEDSVGKYDFRKLMKRMVVFNRNKIVFIIGNDDLSKLPKKLVPEFCGSYKYQVRKTKFICNFGIYINK